MRGSLGASGFYGWHIVGFSALMVATTAPGQTAAVSVFIDPMLADLGLSRSAISTAYLVGTLTGAVTMPFVGRALDRFGVRRVMAAIGVVFSLALCALSAVSSIVGLTAGFVAIRMAGQGALGLAATTAVALWFDRRRGTAIGLVNAVGVSMISLAPVLLESLIAQTGWRRAWLIEGLVVAALVLPVALLAMRDRPADLGQRPDGKVTDDAPPPRPAWGVARAVALRTPFFWTVTGGIASTGLLSTAINFHQIDLLTSHGLSTVEAAANFIPQTVANLVSTLGMGMLVDRLRSRVLVALAMSFLVGALLLATSVTPGLLAVLLGVLLGAANGSIRAIEAATFPRHFGTDHIGAIRGVVTGVSVGSTAFGPLLFAVLYEATGSYTPALLVALPLPLLVIVAAALVHPPEAPAHAGGPGSTGDRADVTGDRAHVTTDTDPDLTR